jgi:hypothetical protein
MDMEGIRNNNNAKSIKEREIGTVQARVGCWHGKKRAKLWKEKGTKGKVMPTGKGWWWWEEEEETEVGNGGVLPPTAVECPSI